MNWGGGGTATSEALTLLLQEGAEANLEQKHYLDALLDDSLFQKIVIFLQNFSFWVGNGRRKLSFYGTRAPS